MEAYEIIYELRKQGLSQGEVAAQMNVRNGIVNNVIHGRSSSYRIASYVASRLGRSVQEIWPGRYEFKPRKV